MKLSEDLRWRGLIKDSTSPEMDKILDGKSVTFYWGTDPSGSSLHLGHLSSLFLVKRLADYGHHPLVLVGGATGLIGDPRPTKERAMITKELLDENYKGLYKQIHGMFGYDMVNNYDWSKDINFIEFLRDYGKYFNVNYMLDKDIIRRRLEDGITYTEFSYMIMQALDFLWLYENKNCVLQVAGSDQWGNITAGVDLIRRKIDKQAYAFTMPLILDKNGNKFGKSEGNALWLDKNMTKPYDMYQFLVNTDDEMVIHYLKVLTFLSKEEIEALEISLKNEPEKRLASKTLAFEVIKTIHGLKEAENAKLTSEEIFTHGASSNMETIKLEENMLEVGVNILDLLVMINLAPSKSEARRLVMQGGIAINEVKIEDPNFIITSNESFVIQKGKKTFIKIEK